MRRNAVLRVLGALAATSLTISLYLYCDLYAVGLVYILFNSSVALYAGRLWYSYLKETEPFSANLLPSVRRAQSEERQLSSILWTLIFAICFLLSSGLALFFLRENTVSNMYVVNDVLTKVESDAIISMSEGYAAKTGGWLTARHANYPTTDLAAYKIKEDLVLFDSGKKMDLSKWLNETLLAERVLPLLSEQYGIRSHLMTMKDLFIVKYDARTPGKQRRLDTHQDSSQLSFNIALTQYDRDYQGGGTKFDILGGGRRTVKIERGAMLTHPSKLFHSGLEITDGQRYLLVGFVSVEKWRGETFYRLFGDFSRCVHKYTYTRSPLVDGSGAGAGAGAGIILSEELADDKETGELKVMYRDESKCRSPFYVLWYSADIVLKSKSVFLAVLKGMFVVMVLFLLSLIGCLVYSAVCRPRKVR